MSGYFSVNNDDSNCALHFFHTQFAYGQLPSVRRDVEIKSSPNFFEKLPKKKPKQFLLENDAFDLNTKSHHQFWLHFKENVSPRLFKNHPMWSH